MDSNVTVTGLLSWGAALWQSLFSVAGWTVANGWWLSLLGVAALAGWEQLQRRLAAEALSRRTYLELEPTAAFAPDPEQIWRQGMQLVRAAGSGPWWVPRRARSVRIRLRADGKRALVYRIEAPQTAHALLAQTPYGDRVHVKAVAPIADKRREHTVRAVLTLHGEPGSRLREVPLDPDPLQPLIDAVADLKAELGDLAEVCVDFSPASRWHLAVRRMQVLRGVRERVRREAEREARWMSRESTDSVPVALTKLLDPREWQGRPTRPMVMPPLRRVARDTALGKLAQTSGLVRVQVLVRCASTADGRAEARLARLGAALDVFAGPSRLMSQGWSVGPVRFGPDRWPWRTRFDARWASGVMRPARGGWAHIEELAGLLKPPTVTARHPLMENDMPTYEVGAGVLPQGWYRQPGGGERLLATHEDETLFEVQSGKAGWGKTMRAQVHAVASAHNARGLAFVDPHGDSFEAVARYLAHQDILDRVMLFDLTVRKDTDMLASWNLLDMSGGKIAHEVSAAVIEAFAGSLGWNDVTAPRALTILTKAVEALVAVNTAAVADQAPQQQATIFQVRALLTDPAFRDLVIAALTPEARSWWTTTFPDLPRDALPTVLNPIERLGASPVVRAFLGCPISGYDIRHAMDEGRVLWICPPGTGPTDRLLISLFVHDFLRAGLSRRDLPESRRRPFRFYLDELISLDQGSTVLAEITEQLRKFGGRLHGMTQLLHRLQPETRAALMQNASCLSTTAGSVEAITQVTAQWPDTITPADVAGLDRWHHYASFTVAGKRIGPLPIRGPELAEVFKKHARPNRVPALRTAAHRAAKARPLGERTALALAQEGQVREFLAARATPTTTTHDTGEQYA
ncbi:type IV secretory system conjugative DNA transfer family protein [Streptomyces sp. RerS4]|uniref:type IV secretory system conjugative DNA transfer family protein n=1 Tax=Streptomyces sp. RerS4 TaxID=2942449 RepID=UPI00201CAAE2|nr:type IV secretory system conjugative DNA transfer family protein [Streptomyces sp. RerS4]UQW99127.1 type IV secretory system conjugative DNA transfer family protein [Streptomyces sp. RerS4]